MDGCFYKWGVHFLDILLMRNLGFWGLYSGACFLATPKYSLCLAGEHGEPKGRPDEKQLSAQLWKSEVNGASWASSELRSILRIVGPDELI